MSTNSVNNNWVKPMLKLMGLGESRNTAEDLGNFRREIEESKLVDRVTEIARQINSEANSRIVDVLEFLPPARSVASVKFSRNRVDHFFEIVVRPAGAKVVFYTSRKIRGGFSSLFGGDPDVPSCKVEFSVPLRPEVTTAVDLQNWFIYLISGFKAEFKPVIRIAAA